MSETSDPRFPFQLGPFRVVAPLGAGAQAQVFTAYLEGDLGFRVKVALKTVEAPGQELTRSVKALANEARTLAAIHHPNVVTVHHFSRHGDRFLLALEYVEGVDLLLLMNHYRNRQMTLPTPAAVQIAEQLAHGLAAAHSLVDARGNPAPMVHRDLKPTNIIISEHGQVKLTDFGLAKGRLTSFHTTKASITRGTPAYMSPEQVEGAELTPASDQFSLGTLLYEMVTGERLFDDNLADTMLRVSEVRPTGDLDRLRSLAPDLGALVERCLQRDPAERFPTTTDLYGALRYVRVRRGQETDLASLVDAARRASLGHARPSDEPVMSTKEFFGAAPTTAAASAETAAGGAAEEEGPERPTVPSRRRPEPPPGLELTADPDSGDELPAGAGMSQEITFVSRRRRG